MEHTNQDQSTTGAALARRDVDQASQTPAIQAMRKAGALAVAEKKALGDMYRMLEGCEWGSGNSVVRGSSFSEAARAALARFCVVTRANPQIHVDLLGGRPYLNSRYYRDMTSADPHFIEDLQINISASASELLRRQAEQAIAEAEKFGLPRPTEEIQRLLEEARTLERLRIEYNVPAWATVAIETRIRRYVENAPLEKIRNGEVENPEAYVRTVRECNWAGNRPRKEKSGGGTYDADPIGNMEPEKTARTRSFRRCAANAFSAWFDQFDSDIQRAQELTEAEWEDVTPSRVQANAIATGAGEPSATRAALPQSLPVQDLTAGSAVTPGEFFEGIARAQRAFNTSGGDMSAARDAFEHGESPESAVARDKPAARQDEDGFDRDAARGTFFGNLRDSGVDDRKAWLAEHGFPDSVTKFTAADFKRAAEIIVGPDWQTLTDLVGQLGFEKVAEYVHVNGRDVPRTLREIRNEIARVRADLERA